MTRLHSFPKVWNLGHPSIADLFSGPVVVQEKVDGSQFSFGVVDGALLMRSKGATVFAETADKLFRGAADTALRLFGDGLLPEGWTYRGEAMMGPKHNALTYERAPVGNFVLFDVDTALERRMDPAGVAAEAERLGLEMAPVHFVGTVDSLETLREYVTRPSFLGGRTEGVVVKNYARWGADAKMLMGKLVADDFKEINAANWKKENPSRADVIQVLIGQYRSEARWQKAVQHLREAGALKGTPADIGALMREVPADIRAECEGEIKDALFNAFWKDISRGVSAGLPEWYKREVSATHFADKAA